MEGNRPVYYQNMEKCVDEVIARVGKNIVMGMPLALGKPNQFANAIYQRAKTDPSIQLTFCTALSLEKPKGDSDLEQRFMGPFVERMFDGYAELDYMKDLRKETLPKNFSLKEFYIKAGSALNVDHAQVNYISTNYTHGWRDFINNGVNVFSQMVSKKKIDGKTFYSMSASTDLALDVFPALRKAEKNGGKIAIIAQVNTNMPFMYGDAVVEPDTYDMVIDVPEYYTRIFGAPKLSVTTSDYMIGMHASTLVRDNGTLQIGIGSLGDALTYGLQMRQEQNAEYKRFLKDTQISDKFGVTIEGIGGTETFDEGLGGSTEMLVDGYLHLIKSGIVKRHTYNNVPVQRLINDQKITETVTSKTLDCLLEEGAVNPLLTADDFNFLTEYGIFKEGLVFENNMIKSGNVVIPTDLTDLRNMDLIVSHCLGDTLKKGILIHSGFFLGPENFYQALHDMSEEERKKIFMTSILNVNQLYENNSHASEELKILQRKNGRFFNTCLMVTLSGAINSDGLENGQVISGVGGQYNFVSMAHALDDARCILMCKSFRGGGESAASNIVYNYGHITIPRHLRDIVVTEYGIADLRSKSDQEIIKQLLNITDSRFQEGLLKKAKKARKISQGYTIPDRFKYNTPERLEKEITPFREKGMFGPFPFGTDFTREELVIGKSLKWLKSQQADKQKRKTSLNEAMSIQSVPESAKPYLERLQLAKPDSAEEKTLQKLVIYALSSTGSI